MRAGHLGAVDFRLQKLNLHVRKVISLT
jgi:hypothetical protein